MIDKYYREVVETEIDFTGYHLFILGRSDQVVQPDYKKWTSWLILMGLVETWSMI